MSWDCCDWCRPKQCYKWYQCSSAAAWCLFLKDNWSIKSFNLVQQRQEQWSRSVSAFYNPWQTIDIDFVKWSHRKLDSKVKLSNNCPELTIGHRNHYPGDNEFLMTEQIHCHCDDKSLNQTHICCSLIISVWSAVIHVCPAPLSDDNWAHQSCFSVSPPVSALIRADTNTSVTQSSVQDEFMKMEKLKS